MRHESIIIVFVREHLLRLLPIHVHCTGMPIICTHAQILHAHRIQKEYKRRENYSPTSLAYNNQNYEGIVFINY